MDSLELALSELATVTQDEPFHFCRYRSKSVPDGPLSTPVCVPEVVLW